MLDTLSPPMAEKYQISVFSPATADSFREISTIRCCCFCLKSQSFSPIHIYFQSPNPHLFLYKIHLSWELEIEWWCPHPRTQQNLLQLLRLGSHMGDVSSLQPSAQAWLMGELTPMMSSPKSPQRLGDVRGYRWEKGAVWATKKPSWIQTNSASWNIRSLSNMRLMVIG